MREKILDYVEFVYWDFLGNEGPYRLVAEDFCAQKTEEAIQDVLKEGKYTHIITTPKASYVDKKLKYHSSVV